MKTDIFDFNFDERHIATKPLENRNDAKLMVIKNGHIDHKHIIDLPDFLNAGDVLVLNNTKVIKARLTGNITTTGRSAKCTITLHKLITHNDNHTLYSVFAKGSKKLNSHDTLAFITSDDLKVTAKILEKDVNGQVYCQFDCPLDILFAFLEQAGTMPLPPYIEKYRKADSSDNSNYQTVFAEHLGSVAAPTASLHLTHDLLEKIKAKNIHF